MKFYVIDINSFILFFACTPVIKILTSGQVYRKLFLQFFALFLVYCACLLGSYSVRLPFGFETGSNPLFFTNIFDIPQLGNEHKYIACKYYLS